MNHGSSIIINKRELSNATRHTDGKTTFNQKYRLCLCVLWLELGFCILSSNYVYMSISMYRCDKMNE